jgi:hypothetical protein
MVALSASNCAKWPRFLECGAQTAVLDWSHRLVCSDCGGREVDWWWRGPSGGSDGRRVVCLNCA